MKQAQCKGFGLISLVAPITTLLNSGLTSRYCWAAPLEIINLTILVCPRQQDQMKAVHLFLLFSTANQKHTLIIQISLSLDTSLHLLILTLLHTGDQSLVEGSLVLACHFLLLLLLLTLNHPHLLLFWRLHLQIIIFENLEKDQRGDILGGNIIGSWLLCGFGEDMAGGCLAVSVGKVAHLSLVLGREEFRASLYQQSESVLELS